MSIETSQKVTASQLKRSAFLYIRQSTPRQVLEHTESTARQYGLRKRAVALGWQDEQVIVIDSDLGQSGASAADREGFQKLVVEVSMGRAGIVLGLEVSRLARNSTDWHRLLEICAITDTLILDEDGIYHPGDFNDRLLLGLKGTMSEAELHLIRARMRGGVLSKAKRGELATPLPFGFAYDDEGRVVLDPDQQMQQAIGSVFEMFRRVGSAFGVAKEFRQKGLQFPRLIRRPGCPVEISWGDLEHNRVTRILRNPRYAGAFFYGRTRFQKKLEGGGRAQQLPRQEWHTLILDAHPGYITWQDYEENLRRLQENAQIQGVEKRSAVREGPSLLQGLAICGKCGGRMTVGYRQRKAGLAPYYVCQGPREVDRIDKGYCQRISGYSLDMVIGALLVETVTPLALEVALNVHQELQSRWEEADRLRRLQVDRARYESELARRRFLRVDPDNRLVAASLEAEWNAKLRALSEAEQNYERQCQADQFKISAAQREQVLALAADFRRLWHDSETPDRERKRMVRLLVEDVMIRKGEKVQLDIRFRGGMSKTLILPRPLSFCESHKQNPEMIAEMHRLLDHYNYADVARILNERNFKTGDALPLTSIAVGYVRKAYGLRSRFDRLRERGLLTISDVAQACCVSTKTISDWRQKGLLRR
ncbi:MAG: recombinase family protein [Acidobacteria bacterium]|nr:recombinase family protein [Acidobacteriota bacterium]